MGRLLCYCLCWFLFVSSFWLALHFPSNPCFIRRFICYKFILYHDTRINIRNHYFYINPLHT